MEPILRAQPGWEERLADALRQIERPITVDPRFAPRDAAGRTNAARFDRSAFPPARAAATLLLLYPDQHGELTVPLTVRHAELRSHAGEVSLPGGAVEAGDTDRAAAGLIAERSGAVVSDLAGGPWWSMGRHSATISIVAAPQPQHGQLLDLIQQVGTKVQTRRP